MKRLQQICFFGSLLLGSVTFCDVARAQPITPYWGKPHQIRPDLYQRRNDGTILERNTGNIYDSRDNLLRPGGGANPAPRFRAPNSYGDSYSPTNSSYSPTRDGRLSAGCKQVLNHRHTEEELIAIYEAAPSKFSWWLSQFPECR
jgi:hypothetical protein